MFETIVAYMAPCSFDRCKIKSTDDALSAPVRTARSCWPRRWPSSRRASRTCSASAGGCRRSPRPPASCCCTTPPTPVWALRGHFADRRHQCCSLWAITLMDMGVCVVSTASTFAQVALLLLHQCMNLLRAGGHLQTHSSNLCACVDNSCNLSPHKLYRRRPARPPVFSFDSDEWCVLKQGRRGARCPRSCSLQCRCRQGGPRFQARGAETVVCTGCSGFASSPSNRTCGALNSVDCCLLQKACDC